MSNSDTCNVTCSNTYSCLKTIMDCGSTSQCLVPCLNSELCKYTQIRGQNSDYLNVHLFADWDSSGDVSPSSRTFCPKQEELRKNCVIDRDAYYTACHNLTILAIDDILIEDFRDYSMVNTIIYKDINYQTKCDRIRLFICYDGNCHKYSWCINDSFITNDPTNMPTKSQPYHHPQCLVYQQKHQ